MEVGVQFGITGRIVLVVRRGHGVEAGADDLPVKGRGALGGQSGSLGFKQQAEFHVVEIGFLVAREQLDQRLRNG